MSIRVNVDATNPGQFFACCGLLELADRLWPGAEGRFDGRQFCVDCTGTLPELHARLADTEINSSLTAVELKRLGTLLSADKKKLNPADIEEKGRLQEKWKHERLHLSAPFDLWIDWWRDEHGERTDLKTWAAKQLVIGMARSMLNAVKATASTSGPAPDSIFQLAQLDSLPFNFDSELSGQGAARDAGFSPDTVGLKLAFRPLLELLAFIGLQRFRPACGTDDDTVRFRLWSDPLLPSVASAVATGSFEVAGATPYEFRLFSRTKYMKSFLPAQPT